MKLSASNDISMIFLGTFEERNSKFPHFKTLLSLTCIHTNALKFYSLLINFINFTIYYENYKEIPSQNSMFPSGNNAPFVNKQFPSGSSNAAITTDPNLSKLQNILFEGFPNTHNTSVPQAPSISAFDSIWTNNNMFPAINNSNMPLLQHQLSDNVNGNGNGIDQKSSNGPLFPTNHLFQQQRSLNSQTQDSIPDLMSLETKPPNSNFMNSSSPSNSQVQSLFESNQRGPLQRQSSGGEGGNKLLAGLFGKTTALDIGAGLDNMSPGTGRPSQFSNYDVNSHPVSYFSLPQTRERSTMGMSFHKEGECRSISAKPTSIKKEKDIPRLPEI